MHHRLAWLNPPNPPTTTRRMALLPGIPKTVCETTQARDLRQRRSE
jgi:hypothetical protein